MDPGTPCDAAKVGMPHNVHEYVIGDGVTYICLGWPAALSTPRPAWVESDAVWADMWAKGLRGRD